MSFWLRARPAVRDTTLASDWFACWGVECIGIAQPAEIKGRPSHQTRTEIPVVRRGQPPPSNDKGAQDKIPRPQQAHHQRGACVQSCEVLLHCKDQVPARQLKWYSSLSLAFVQRRWRNTTRQMIASGTDLGCYSLRSSLWLFATSCVLWCPPPRAERSLFTMRTTRAQANRL